MPDRTVTVVVAIDCAVAGNADRVAVAETVASYAGTPSPMYLRDAIITPQAVRLVRHSEPGDTP